MKISPDSCIVVTPSHLRQHTKLPGLDDPAQSHFSCFLLPSPILHELEKNYVKPLHCFALSWYKPSNQYHLVDSNNCSLNILDMSLDCQKPTFIYSHYRFRMRKLTSPRLDKRMKVSSPWLEAIEINEEVNTYVYFKRTPSAQSVAVKVILTLQISTINTIFVRGV